MRCPAAAPATAIALVLCVLTMNARAAHASAQTGPSQTAPTGTLERIGGLLDRNDLGAATQEVAAALKSFPSDPALLNLAGAIEAQSGATAAATSHFQAAIRLAPGVAAPYENLGRLYQEQSRSDPAARGKALEVYQRLLAFDPQNVEGCYQSGFLLALDGKFAAARASLDRLPPDIRSQPQALTLTATVLEGVGDAAGASDATARWMASASRSAPDVLALAPAFSHLPDHTLEQRLLEALDERQQATPDALQQLGRVYMATGRYKDARAVLERAARPAPGVPVLIDLARAADKAGDHEGALGYLAHARDLDPSNAGVHFLFGVVCVELDLVAEAYESLKKALALDPDNADFNYVMGSVAMHRHEPADSLPYLEKYLQLKPDDPRAHLALGVGRFNSGQFAAATADLQIAAKYPETEAGARYFLGRVARQDGDLDQARREIERSIQVSAVNADVWAELGLIDTRQGRFADAERDLDKALALNPDNYLATVNLAALFTRTRDPRKDAQAAKLAALQEKRSARAQDFLRTIEVVP